MNVELRLVSTLLAALLVSGPSPQNLAIGTRPGRRKQRLGQTSVQVPCDKEHLPDGRMCGNLRREKPLTNNAFGGREFSGFKRRASRPVSTRQPEGRATVRSGLIRTESSRLGGTGAFASDFTTVETPDPASPNSSLDADRRSRASRSIRTPRSTILREDASQGR